MKYKRLYIDCILYTSGLYIEIQEIVFKYKGNTMGEQGVIHWENKGNTLGEYNGRTRVDTLGNTLGNTMGNTMGDTLGDTLGDTRGIHWEIQVVDIMLYIRYIFITGFSLSYRFLS